MDFMEYQPKTWDSICTNVETMILDFAGADDRPMDCSAVRFAKLNRVTILTTHIAY